MMSGDNARVRPLMISGPELVDLSERRIPFSVTNVGGRIRLDGREVNRAARRHIIFRRGVAVQREVTE